MLSEAGLRVFGDILIGDVGDYYTYKSGSKIVAFFNSNFGFNDVYKAGFQSRWLYTLEKLKVLYNNQKFDEFLKLVLSKRFIMRDNSLNEVQALKKIKEIIEFLNEELSVEGYKIQKNGQNFNLISVDNDLVFIGYGGFADVYKSKSSGLIVKKLKDDFKTLESIRHRFKREFELTKSLSDLQGVISVYEYDESDISYTMEEAESTLEKFIKEYDHNENTKLVMIRQILFIMKSVHERNIIHRDISPNNILLFNGQLKISDFGLGKDLDMFYSHRTMRTHSMGQYYYCAPEQFMQLKEGDKKSDVYSLGSLINFIISGDPKNSKHFLRNAVEKAKNENPSLRYSDAGQLLQGIELSISYHENQQRNEMVSEKIRNNIYDDDVENFIYGLGANELCKAIIEKVNMVEAVISFIEVDEKRTIETLQMIESEYTAVCRCFEDYDDFGTIAYNVISNNMAYVAQEIAAKILKYIAIDVNRYGIHRLMDDLVESGVDPLIENLLIG